MGDWTDLVQWPAFGASVLAAWLVGSKDARRRRMGFWVFLASNVLWVCWGLPAGAHAVIALQACLAVTNIRGLLKAEP